MVPESFGCGVSVLAAIAMLAPSRAARSAMARPMPREAPVMKSVLPARDVVAGAADGDVAGGEAADGMGRRRDWRRQRLVARTQRLRLRNRSKAARASG